MGLNIYKRGQGKYTRIGTVMGVLLIVLIGAYKLSLQFEASTVAWVQHPAFAFGVPTALIAIFALLTLWIINRIRPADFLIATEGEMKKVSWSSRREVTGSTKVVILTTFIMAGLLFAVDMLLLVVFTRLKILGSGT